MKTQGRLHRALASLVHEKDYDTIVVKQILARANVSRSTFYAHFGDKDELLISTIHDMLRSARTRKDDGILWFSLPILEYHDRHRHANGPRMGTRGRMILHERLRGVLVELIANDRQTPVRDLLARHIASTFVLVLNWWGESGSSLSATEVDAMFRRLITPAIQEIGRPF